MPPRVDPEVLCVMVHRVRSPRRCFVTWRAIMREHLRYVIRIRHLLKIRLVALEAIGILQLVIAIHVTCLACRGTVRSCQRKIRGAVIERCRTPRR